MVASSALREATLLILLQLGSSTHIDAGGQECVIHAEESSEGGHRDSSGGSCGSSSFAEILSEQSSFRVGHYELKHRFNSSCWQFIHHCAHTIRIIAPVELLIDFIAF